MSRRSASELCRTVTPVLAVVAAAGTHAMAFCYPNCDGSTTAPFLNVNDFSCFLERFVAQDPYANCDGVCNPPCFSSQDFACFLQRYVAGCSAP